MESRRVSASSGKADSNTPSSKGYLSG